MRVNFRQQNRFSKCATIVSTVLLCILASSLSAQSYKRGDFMPGDAIRIVTWQEPSIERANIESLQISDDYIIDRQGKIFLPLLGDVVVVGMTKIELAEFLKKKYMQYSSGLHFVCKPLLRITMLGMVNKPGLYLVEEKASLWEAVDLAEGPAPNANLEKISIMRSGEVVSEDLLKQYENAYSLEEIGVRSGDQIIIEERSNFSWRSVLEVGSFVASGVILYLQIRREANRD